MFKNPGALTRMAFMLAGLAIGVVLGHWMTTAGSTPRNPETVAGLTPEASPKSDAATFPSPNFAAATNLIPDSSVPKKSLDEILKERNPRNRTKELEALVNGLPASEFGAMLKRLRQMPEGSARELASRLFVARWIEIDPEGALQFASQNHEFDYIGSDVFQQFAADDAQSALARAESIADPNMRYQALRGVLTFMADQDPMGALQLASSFGPFPNNEPLSQVIYRQWSTFDPEAAAAQASQDPSGTGWRSPVGQVLRNWATQDPLAAINWSLASSDPAMQARDISQVMRQWSREDLNAAANWVSSAPAGSARDAAAAALAFSIASTDPTAAVGWVESMTDATQRDNALQRLAREIMYLNPTNGSAVLQAAGVPANLIPAVNNPNQRTGGGRR